MNYVIVFLHASDGRPTGKFVGTFGKKAAGTYLEQRGWKLIGAYWRHRRDDGTVASIYPLKKP